MKVMRNVAKETNMKLSHCNFIKITNNGDTRRKQCFQDENRELGFNRARKIIDRAKNPQLLGSGTEVGEASVAGAGPIAVPVTALLIL
ncbi:hypothetical protein H1P_1190014 [Hyella patelloides LEGE 07179]|uniref:Uncharacterized protein n=1 Tax=Hyella patelloides LEGE 07179 TaxID=945734 RepID=A0A563VKA4_9CYAN|nr:hypothetical protein H1P_1190014 [Hyella patelloides LEGE 07179]